MNTTCDNEATQYQNPENEATQLENNSTAEQTGAQNATPAAPTGDKAQEKPAAKGSTLKRVAAGAASGLLIGGVASVLMGMKAKDDDDTTDEDKSDSGQEEQGADALTNPGWVDGEISVASAGSDDMSFGEAFAAARAEVGPGGCFEWHGNLYATYTAEEWEGMTAQERADWSDHFSWNHIDRTDSDVAQHSTPARQTPADPAADQIPAEESADITAQVPAEEPAEEPVAGQPADQTDRPEEEVDGEDDDIEVVTVDPAGNDPAAAQANVEGMPATEQDIEIIGVVHDAETDTNVGTMTVDGHDVILIDVDNDMAFDYMAADDNNNGQLDPGEVVDIQGQGLTVNDLGGFSNPTGDLYADNEGPDYSAEGIYEG